MVAVLELIPYAWRTGEPGDGLAKKVRAPHARIHDAGAIRRSVAAVDTAACQIDQNVNSFELRHPIPVIFAIPQD